MSLRPIAEKSLSWAVILLLGAGCGTAKKSPDSGLGEDSGPPTQCTIAGATYAAAAPNSANPCQSCQPAASATDWSALPQGTACGTGAVCSSGTCFAGCAIEGVFYSPDALNQQAACQSCQPQQSTTAWSPLTSAAGSGCDGGEDICLAGACQAGCRIAGALVTPGSTNGEDACQICDPTLDRADWSPAPDGTYCGSGQLCVGGGCQNGCFVAGAFYLPAQPNPADSCQSCQPLLASTGFSPLTGLPQGNDCDAGQVCSTGACARGCFIAGAFDLPGARNPTDSSSCCSPLSSTSDWTNAFLARAPLHTGSGPMGVALADFNGDGLLDIATVNRADSTVTVFFSASDGGYIGPLILQVGASPVAIVAVDVNSDRIPDILVANADDQTVSVLLNAGSNLGFNPQKTYGTLGNPSALAVADLNGDHRPDIAVTDLDQGMVAILFGAGAGTFEAAVPLNVGSLPQAIVAADFDGDLLIDLAVANAGDDNIDILRNTGNGVFAAPASYPVGSHPTAMVAVDLNGDSKPDLVVANAFDDSLGVLMNQGNGTFPPQVAVGLGFPAYSLAAGDFNGDGAPDVALADYNGGRAGILLNRGQGILANPFYVPVGAAYSAFGVAAGDLNGDLVPDLAVVGLDDSSLEVLLNTCH